MGTKMAVALAKIYMASIEEEIKAKPSQTTEVEEIC